jgi:hypothetical protein
VVGDGGQAVLHKLTGDERERRFGLEVADWMIDSYQWSGERSRRGPTTWVDTTRCPTELPAMQTFCYSEGTAAAYHAGAPFAARSAKGQVRRSTREAIRFLEVMQFDDRRQLLGARPIKVVRRREVHDERAARSGSTTSATGCPRSRSGSTPARRTQKPASRCTTPRTSRGSPARGAPSRVSTTPRSPWCRRAARCRVRAAGWTSSSRSTVTVDVVPNDAAPGGAPEADPRRIGIFVDRVVSRCALANARDHR